MLAFTRSKLRCAFLTAGAALLTTSAAVLAQTAASYPSTQLRIVVPYPAGGGTDIFARLLGAKLTDSWGQQVIVDNRAGANGTVGTAYVAKAPADGQTILIVPAGYAANPALYKQLPYDQTRELIAVSELASGPLVLVVHPSLPAHSVKELIALARSRPDVINFGSAGTGSLPHLSGELFNLMAGTKLVHIPYKGASRRRQRCARRACAGLFHEHSAKPAADQDRETTRARRDHAGTQPDRAGHSDDRGERAQKAST